MRLSAEMIAAAEQRPNPLGERELILRGLGIPAMEHLGATRDAFDTLDFSNNQLTRLDNLPKLPRLQQLLLSNNLIDTVDLMKDNTPNVTAVTLSYNRIQDLHVVESMGKAFPKLEFLSLVGNTVTRELRNVSCVCLLHLLVCIPLYVSSMSLGTFSLSIQFLASPRYCNTPPLSPLPPSPNHEPNRSTTLPLVYNPAVPQTPCIGQPKDQDSRTGKVQSFGQISRWCRLGQ